MLISTAIMWLLWILGFATLPVLIVSIINKSSARAKALLAVDIFIPVFSFILYWLADILGVNLYLEIIIYFMFAIGFAAVDLASIIILCVRMRKLRKGDKIAPIVITTLVLILAPVIFMSVVCIRQVVILRQSTLVIDCESSGNGGIGDYSDFVYAYDGDKVTLLDLGSSYELEKYLPDDMEQSKDQKEADSFSVDSNGDAILIFENGSLVEEHEFESGYFNVDIVNVYYSTSDK